MDTRRSALQIGRFSIAFLAISVILICVMKRSVSQYDEGIILVGATRVQEGQIPYRDFYANYGPGQFYMLAALFDLFGRSVLIERLWDTAVRASIVLLAYGIVRTSGPRLAAWTAAVLVTAWLGSVGAYGYPVFPCLLCSLAMILCLIRARKSGRGAAPWLFTAGASAGVSVLFRFDVGFYNNIVLGIAACTGMRGVGEGYLSAILRAATFCAAGVATVCLPAAAALSASGAIPDLLFDNVQFPAATYVKMRSLPFPRPIELVLSPDKISIYAILAVAAMVCGVVVLDRHRRVAGTGPGQPSKWLLVSLSLLSIVLFFKGFVRMSVIHVAISFVPTLMLVTLVVPALRRGVGPANWPLNLAIKACAVVVFLPILWVFADDARTLARNAAWVVKPPTEKNSFSSCWYHPSLIRIGCFEVDPSWSALATYIDDTIASNRTIFVGLPRHDIVFINDVLLYFATGRRPATPWYHMDPGLQTTASVQSSIIKDLKESQPALVILSASWDDVREPNGSAVSSGVRLLDEYIAAHYVQTEKFGMNLVYKPRS